MRVLLLTALFLVAAPFASAQGADHLIGRPYAGLPGGWADIGGSLLPSLDDGHEYALSTHQSVYEPSRLFLYTRLERRVDERYPVWTVLAALVVEDIGEDDEAIALACIVAEGTAVIAVVGEGFIDEAEGLFRYGPVRLAWSLDRETEQFVSLDPTSVTCPDQDLP